MGTLKKDFKYKIIDNFLTNEEQKLLKDYCELKHRLNVDSFDTKQNNNCDTYFYGDPLMESLMINKKHILEKESNLKLIPTYSFWRMYSTDAILKKHRDRGSCEVSVTVQIDSDGEWPIYMDGKAITIKNKQAVMYWGTDTEHWREGLKTDFQSQAFLHYVDQNGPYTDQAFDTRKMLGTQRTTPQTT
jgi:hypothetical protein